MINDVDLVRFVHEISRTWAGIPQLGELYRTAVHGLLVPLGFDRASLFLYNSSNSEVRGTWATDEEGRVVDNSKYFSFLSSEEKTLTEALSQPDRIKVWENQVLNVGPQRKTQGWSAMVALLDGDRILGWLKVDNAFRKLKLTDLERELLALYGQNLSREIQRHQFSEMVERLQKQNDLKDKLFAILSHDLRGPIGNLNLLIKCFQDGTLDPKESEGIFDTLSEASTHAYDLLENLLGWVRAQIQGVEALQRHVVIYQILKSVHDWLISMAKAKGIALVIDCPAPLSVLTDEKILETIMRNLVSNAIKFSKEASTVILKAYRKDELVILEVIDQGRGIPRDKLEVLLNNKYVHSQLGTDGEKGHGLGLMFSKDLAHSFGGRLEAESTPGLGSTFRLVLLDKLDGEL